MIVHYNDKIVKTFSGTTVGHEKANTAALQKAIADPNHGYYLHKDKDDNSWCIVQSHLPPRGAKP